MDGATSDHAGVQAQLDRLAALSPGADILGLSRIRALCDRLGQPERALPPVFHVAGTNGKGSTCAVLRAALEAAGHRVHAYTSPHLVRFNERIRLAGALVGDDHLAALLAEVLAVADGIAPSFFEVTTAAALLAFARTPADACVIEVGLGGRLDATNIVPDPLVCGIAQLGLDHQAFLGDTLSGIAAEKAGIAKQGAPLVTQHYPPELVAPIAAAAARVGAAWRPRGTAWDIGGGDVLAYRDDQGTLALPRPGLPGDHQTDNAGLAVAMLRHQDRLAIPVAALATGVSGARWPARLQALTDGRLPAMLPEGSRLWLDGGHNPAAAEAIATFFHDRSPERPLHVIVGLLANKDLTGFLDPIARCTPLIQAVPVPGHACHAPAEIVTAAERHGLAAGIAIDPQSALQRIADRGTPATVLIAGSLYLAGRVLAANHTPPD